MIWNRVFTLRRLLTLFSFLLVKELMETFYPELHRQYLYRTRFAVAEYLEGPDVFCNYFFQKWDIFSLMPTTQEFSYHNEVLMTVFFFSLGKFQLQRKQMAMQKMGKGVVVKMRDTFQRNHSTQDESLVSELHIVKLFFNTGTQVFG